MTEILPFKKPTRHYEYSKEQYLYFILAGLEHLHPGDHLAQAGFILDCCQFISIGRLEQFNRKVSAANIEHSQMNSAAPSGDIGLIDHEAAPTAKKENSMNDSKTSGNYLGEFEVNITVNEPVSPKGYLNFLGTWYTQVFASLGPTIRGAITASREAGALSDEDVHHLAVCLRSLASKKPLLPAQLGQWHHVWGQLMGHLKEDGVDRVEIPSSGMLVSTDSVVYPWMTH